MNENAETRELLRRWLEGDASDAGERALERAAAADPELAGELESHRRLRERLRALPVELEPGRDLWPAIAARLPRRRRPLPLGLLSGLAAAAALLVAVRLADRPPAPPAPAPPPAVVVPVELAAYAETGRELDAVRDELRRAIEARQESLPPETRRLVFESLATIERAIDDIEAALARLPADPELARAYVAYREREIALLRQANRMAARL